MTDRNRWTFDLYHDFNQGTNEAGFHEVVLDPIMETLVRRDMTVRVVDRDQPSLRVSGRIRCIVAIVEATND